LRERFFEASGLIGTRYGGSVTVAILSLVNEAKIFLENLKLLSPFTNVVK
jgi:hypothetical protein